MERYSFGALDRSIIQFAYTVDDIRQGMRRYTELLHIGPWFLIGPFVPARGVSRGRDDDEHQPGGRFCRRGHGRADRTA